MKSTIKSFEQLNGYTSRTFPLFPGDQIRVHTKIHEGGRERIQTFEGTVLCVRGRGSNRTFLVRKKGAGAIGVERIFPVGSPYLVKVDVTGHMKVRRAKLTYLRPA